MELRASYFCPNCNDQHSLNALEEFYLLENDTENVLEFFLDIERWFSGKLIQD